VIEGINPLNDIIILSGEKATVIGAYRGFKCFPGESEYSNWVRLTKDLDLVNFQEVTIIIGDLNIDPNRDNFMTSELINLCDSKVLSMIERKVTRMVLFNSHALTLY